MALFLRKWGHFLLVQKFIYLNFGATCLNFGITHLNFVSKSSLFDRDREGVVGSPRKGGHFSASVWAEKGSPSQWRRR